MRRWWVTLALLLSLGINLGLLAAVAAGRWADRREAAEEPPPAVRGDDRGPHHRGRPHGLGEPPLGRLADHLGLAGERRERFVALQRRFVRAHLEARGERARLGAALRQELMAEEPDPERVDALIAGLGETYLASERATAEVVLASRELLDGEQRRQYLRFLQRLRHGGQHGGRPEGPGAGGRRRHP